MYISVYIVYIGLYVYICISVYIAYMYISINDYTKTQINTHSNINIIIKNTIQNNIKILPFCSEFLQTPHKPHFLMLYHESLSRYPHNTFKSILNIWSTHLLSFFLARILHCNWITPIWRLFSALASAVLFLEIRSFVRVAFSWMLWKLWTIV